MFFGWVCRLMRAGGRGGMLGFRVSSNIECWTGSSGRVYNFPVVFRFKWVVVVACPGMYINIAVLIVISIFAMNVWLVFMNVIVRYVWHVLAGPRGRRAQPTHTQCWRVSSSMRGSIENVVIATCVILRIAAWMSVMEWHCYVPRAQQASLLLE